MWQAAQGGLGPGDGTHQHSHHCLCLRLKVSPTQWGTRALLEAWSPREETPSTVPFGQRLNPPGEALAAHHRGREVGKGGSGHVSALMEDLFGGGWAKCSWQSVLPAAN